MADFDIDLAEGLADTDFAIGERRFRISKFGTMAGWNILEKLRHEFARTDFAIGERNPNAFLMGVLSLDPAFVEKLRQTLFNRVEFEHNGTQLALADNEDLAFEGLEPVAVYEVIVRSLAVNFTPSWRAALSRLGGAASATTGSAAPST